MMAIRFSSTFAASLAAILSLAVVPTVIAEQDGGNGGYNNGGYSSVYGSNGYAESTSTYYDGYAQAWRYLGWYVECNGGSSRYYDRSEHSHESGSGDQQVFGNNYCQRYLMWAAVSTATLFKELKS